MPHSGPGKEERLQSVKGLYGSGPQTSYGAPDVAVSALTSTEMPSSTRVAPLEWSPSDPEATPRPIEEADSANRGSTSLQQCPAGRRVRGALAGVSAQALATMLIKEPSVSPSLFHRVNYRAPWNGEERCPNHEVLPRLGPLERGAGALGPCLVPLAP